MQSNPDRFIWVILPQSLSKGCSVDCRCILSEGSTERESTSKLTHSVVVGMIQFLPGDWNEGLNSWTSFLPCWPLHKAACNITAGFFLSEWAGESESRLARQKLLSLYNLVSEVASSHFCHVLFIRSKFLVPAIIQEKRDYIKVCT